MKDPNTEEHTNADYYQLLFQSEFSNLVTNKELSSQIFYSLLGEAKDKKISKKESKPKTTFAIMKKLERDIDKKENKRKELETKLFDKEIYTNITKVNEINDMIENLTKEIENLYDEWENISE